jgi:hypothetical protein
VRVLWMILRLSSSYGSGQGDKEDRLTYGKLLTFEEEEKEPDSKDDAVQEVQTDDATASPNANAAVKKVTLVRFTPDNYAGSSSGSSSRSNKNNPRSKSKNEVIEQCRIFTSLY